MHYLPNIASGVVSNHGGQLYHVHITKAGTGASSVTIYDNPSAASGTILWQGDGLTSQDFDCTNGSGVGMVASTGIYLALAGTTAPTVGISYD